MTWIGHHIMQCLFTLVFAWYFGSRLVYMVGQFRERYQEISPKRRALLIFIKTLYASIGALMIWLIWRGY